jgi:hypothetical protein
MLPWVHADLHLLWLSGLAEAERRRAANFPQNLTFETVRCSGFSCSFVQVKALDSLIRMLWCCLPRWAGEEA